MTCSNNDRIEYLYSKLHENNNDEKVSARISTGNSSSTVQVQLATTLLLLADGEIMTSENNVEVPAAFTVGNPATPNAAAASVAVEAALKRAAEAVATTPMAADQGKDILHVATC
jgi:hypothetical protein